MSYEEKGTWVYLLVSAGTYVAYVVWLLTRLQAEDMGIADVAYVVPLLWSIGISVVAAIVLRIALEIVAPSESQRADVRDREIARFGEAAGHWPLVAGALLALILTLAEAAHFWIANSIYLGFVLMAIVGASAQLIAYRRGF